MLKVYIISKNELISVNSFKNYIEDTPKNLIHYAINRKYIEIFKHYNKEIYGFMWYLERLQKLDKKIVNLFKKFYAINNISIRKRKRLGKIKILK